MKLLNKKYNQVYGQYTSGAGFILKNKKNNLKVFSSKNINIYKKTIKSHMRRMGIDKQIKNKVIMDVGTGRQAISFTDFKPKKIYHYDISRTNVKNFKKYINKKKLKNIYSNNVDLVEHKLPKNKFDLVYLHGIAQHFSHTGKGLINIFDAMKPNSYLWLYFYRSGTYAHFIHAIIRKLTRHINIEEFYKFILLFSYKSEDILLLKNNKAVADYFTASIMDTAFVDYHYLYEPKQVRLFLKENYITITGSSLEYPKTKDRVNHDLFHESVIFYCKKENIIKNKKKKNSKYILSPKSSIDQTNLNLYIKNSIQYKILKIFHKKFNKIKNDKFLIAAISFKLKKIQFEGKTNKNKKINSKFYLNKILELFKNI